MSNVIYFYFKILRLLASKKFMPVDVINSDYNSLAPTYDQYFSILTRPHSQEMIRRLGVRNGANALDLACGTGVITEELQKYIGQKGKITAVDMSKGMIEKAKEKVKSGVEFIQGDMLTALGSLESNSFDYVTCGWAIGYSNPLELLKRVKAVLKNGGKIGIIENRQDTLGPLRKTGIEVMKRYPAYIEYLIDLPFRLPKSKEKLADLYRRAGLKTIEVWDGEVGFNFKSGSEVLNWALHTGASAGFDRVMDPKIRDKCDATFIEIIEKDYKKEEGITISHRYVAGIGQKP